MYCPGCNSKLGRESLLGALGTMKHYRCRYCGVMSCKRTRMTAMRRFNAVRVRPATPANCLLA